MRLAITLHAGSKARERLLELSIATWTQNGAGRLAYRLDGQPGEADVVQVGPSLYSVLVGGHSYDVHVERCPSDKVGRDLVFTAQVAGRIYRLEVHDPRRRRAAGPAGLALSPQEILAPMPGRVVKILVTPNQEVSEGEGLMVMEAMKMQNELRAPRPGRIERIYVEEGAGVETGVKLVRLA